MNPAGATRQIYWNISHIWLMYVLLLPALSIFAYGFYRQVRKWRRGAPAARFDQPLKRFKLLFEHALAQLAYFKAPGYVAFVDAVPLTPSQKIQRAELRDLARSLPGQPNCVDTRALKKRQP